MATKWKFEKGYEGKRIVNPTTVNLEELKTDREIIVACAELSKAAHWRKDAEKGKLASKKSKQIVDEVRKRLEQVGWHAHIFKTGSCECKCRAELYLHMLAGLPEVSEVSFSSETNIDLTEEELFYEDGSLRTKEATLNLLRKRIGKEVLNLPKMVADNEIANETASIVQEIMREEGHSELHEVDEDNRTFRCGAKEYTWRRDENEAEGEARERLEDGEMWRLAVQNNNTMLGLDDWVDYVLNIDGWEPELCSYDGCSHELENGEVYWRTN